MVKFKDAFIIKLFKDFVFPYSKKRILVYADTNLIII